MVSLEPDLAIVLAVAAVAGAAAYGIWFARKMKEYRCASCGQSFTARGLALRFGIGGVPGLSKYYVKCPHCGQRRWNTLTAYA